MSSTSNNISTVLFDRDSTLIDREHSIINPDIMIPLLLEIINIRKMPWGIVSTGAHSAGGDEALTTLRRQHGFDFSNNPPAYPLLGRRSGNTLNKIIPDWKLLSSEPTITIVPSNKTPSEEAKEQYIRDALTVGEFNIATGTLTHTIKHGSDTITIKATVNPTDQLKIRLGNTVVLLNTSRWLSSVDTHNIGDNKFIQALLALDEKKTVTSITEGMRELGVDEIIAPPEYQQVSADSILFLDDKKGVIDLMQKAGFTAIRADTNEARFKGDSNDPEPEQRNTYVNSLLEQLDTNRQYLAHVSINRIKSNLCKLIEGNSFKVSNIQTEGSYKIGDKEIKVPSRIIKILEALDTISVKETMSINDFESLRKICRDGLNSSTRLSSFFPAHRANEKNYYQTLLTEITKIVTSIQEGEMQENNDTNDNTTAIASSSTAT